MVDIPSLEQLRAADRQARAEAKRPRLEQDAVRYGVKFKPGEDIWRLLHKVNAAYEETVRRPEVEARAKRLGVPISYFGVPRSVTSISLACWDAEERLRLAHEQGYDRAP